MLRIEVVTSDNVRDACRLKVEPSQERFVAPIAQSLAVLDEARRRGADGATVLWVPGPDGPEGFYRNVGFLPTGEELDGEIVGEIAL